MRCLIDYIGLKGCNEQIPRSGYYINSQAGISLAALDSLANEEQLSYKGFWADVQERAALRFGSEVLAAVNRHVRNESLFLDTRFGYVTDPITALPSAAQLQGIHINFGLLRFATVWLSSIGLYAMAGGSMDLLVYDFTTGELLETIPLVLVAGYNQVALNREYPATSYRRRLFIGYRGDQALALAKSVPWTFDGATGNWLNGTADCPSPATTYGVGGYYGQAFGGSVPDPKPPVYQNVKSNGTYGLQLDFQIRCSPDAFLCTVLEAFRSAWINLLCCEIMLERINSQRINKFTTVTPEKAKALHEYYETQYQAALSTAVDNLRFPPDVCFPCNELVSIRYDL